MSQKMPETLPAYSQDPLPESEVPAIEPPQYQQRTPSQEAARLKSLQEFADQKRLENAGAYMETFYIGGQTVTNGHLVQQPGSSTSTSHNHHYPSASQEKAALANQYGENDSFDQGGSGSSSSHHDAESRPGVGKRISGFLKRISPAERSMQKAMAWTPEEEAANAKKYPMAQGTYAWENYGSSKKQ
ncbi:hypothetical protein MBLNU457_g2497t1 [Dothideomycetes sp. NU457]